MRAPAAPRGPRSAPALLVTALAALWPIPASADAPPGAPLEELLGQPILSGASRALETAGDAPATTSIITAEELRRYGLSSLDQAINFLSVGMVTESGLAAAEINSRGVLLSGDYGNHVLVLLDGHPANEPWDGTFYFDQSAGIPLELVDHIEVILGPGSALYGSNAMLGVLNVVTRRPGSFDGLHLLAEARQPTLLHGAASYGQELDLFGSTGGLLLGVDFRQELGPTSRYGPQNTGPSPAGSAGPDVVWAGLATHRSVQVPSAYARLSLGSFELTLRWAAATRSALSRSGSFDDPNNWDGDRWLSAGARYSLPVTARLQLSLRAFVDTYRYLQRSPDFRPDFTCLGEQTAGCTFGLDGGAQWGGGEVSAAYDWSGDGATVSRAGLQAQLRHTTTKEFYRDAATGDAVTTVDKANMGGHFAAWLEQTLRPAQWLRVNAGLRLDAAQSFGAHLSPRVALVSPAWTGGAVKLIYAGAFRTPTEFEEEYGDLTGWVVAKDLRPETVQSLELSAEQRFGPDTARLSSFYSHWSDLIVAHELDPEELLQAISAGLLLPSTTAASAYRNESGLDSAGLTFDYSGSRLRQRLRYGLSATLARSRSGLQRLSAAAELFGNARASFDLGGGLPVLALAVRWVGARLVANSGFAERPRLGPQAELVWNLSGPLPWLSGASWHVGGSASTGDRGPYGVGPIGPADPQHGYTAQELTPVPQFTLQAGLRHGL